MRLTGKVAIVTGGGSGVGRAISFGLAEEGARVVVAGRNRRRLEEVAEEIGCMGQEGMVVQTDVTQYAQVERLAQRTLAEYGGIDILVNSASARLPATLLEVSEDEWFHASDVNIHGAFRCCQVVARAMAPRRSGVIVNVLASQGYLHLPWGQPPVAADLSRYGIRMTCVYAARGEGGSNDDQWRPQDVAGIIDFIAIDGAEATMLGSY